MTGEGARRPARFLEELKTKQNMSNWFECKVKYLKEASNGLLKSTTAYMVVDAMTFTEAETRLTDELTETLKEFELLAAKRSNIKEIVFYGDTPKWHRCAVKYATIDEGGDKEKNVTMHLLINADSVEDANDRLVEHLADMQVPYEVVSVKLDKISEVLEYKPKGE